MAKEDLVWTTLRRAGCNGSEDEGWQDAAVVEASLSRPRVNMAIAREGTELGVTNGID